MRHVPRSAVRSRRAAVVALLLVAAAAGCASGDTSTATDVTDRAATLRADGSAGGQPITYWFEYGTTAAYGSETPHRDGGSGTETRTVTERVAGLSPDTTYHYRACAANASGSGCGQNRTFRTGSAGMLPGFQETVPFNGLEFPTAVRFAPDGRVFIAEKPGAIKVFDGPGDTTATTVVNLRPRVNHHWDRGLLGLAIDPNFPARPFIYALYTYDAPIGGTAPTWNDNCPTPPGATTDGCVVSARLSRFQLEGNQVVGDEQVLIEDWCQQAPTHSIGDLHFGADGALYVSGGEGASPYFADYGQLGVPRNPCGDPPAGVGGTQTPPASEGGALRSQDVRTPNDPTTLDGTILRIDPDTGDALPANPYAASGDPDRRRVIAYGLRNPFRFAIRPGTNEVWIGDVGWNTTEEINRVVNPTDGTVENFGWPCYEGLIRQGGYDAANLSLCESLYGSGGVTSPFFSYEHKGSVVAGEPCAPGTSSISGMAFTPESHTLPAEFDGALFFADYARRCIWVMERDGGSLPSPSKVKVFRSGGTAPVDLQFGPGGDLYYADAMSGSIRRIHYTDGNQAPRPVVSASPTNGDAPLDVTFDASGSSDPDAGAALSFAWDLDDDGEFDDGTTPVVARTFTEAGSYRVGLRVNDEQGASATDHVAVTAGNTPPIAAITSPTTGRTWRAGDTVTFEGGATDRQDGALPTSALSWSLVLNHCPAGCHAHGIQSYAGVDAAAFEAPDHAYPSYLELRLTATDSGGLSDTRTIRLDPRTVDLLMASSPSGLQLGLNGEQLAAPFRRTVIEGSANVISAPGPQTLGRRLFNFSSWSPSGGATHTFTANATGTYTARFAARGETTPPGGTTPKAPPPPDPGDGAQAPDRRRVARALNAELAAGLRLLRKSSPRRLVQARRFTLERVTVIARGVIRVRLATKLTQGRSVLLASGARRYSRAGTAEVTVRLTRAGRRLLADGGRTATLGMSFTARTGARTVRIGALRLRRGTASRGPCNGWRPSRC